MSMYLSRPAAALAAAVLAAVLLGACGSGTGTGPSANPAGTPAATTPAAPSTSASPVPPPPADALLLGPTGYGRLRLGMTQAQAAATKLITPLAGKQSGCYRYAHLVGSPATGEHDIAGRLFFSETLGLAAIYAYSGVKTPEGITVGSTFDELRRAYPSWESVSGDKDGRGYVRVPGNAEAIYRIEVGAGKVIQLSVQLLNQDCYE
ncbi:hypothetical protein [Catellatospora sichuanensis]|uniref:hypothetical protein n=1 Tax=Catellatospora sichuanensis TaxID=1969805 RepID=UPI0011834681|nr:hypothetical protein [Catellatospora sichuanensis]